MKISRFQGALAALLLLSAPASALARDDSPLVLEPASAWNLHGTEQGCSLRRLFGPENRRVTLSLTRNVPTENSHSLEVSGKPFNPFNNDTDIRVRYGKTAAVQALDGLLWGRTDDHRPSLYSGSSILPGNPDGDFTIEQVRQAEQAADEIAFIRDGQAAVVLQTGSLAKPFEAMRGCTDALVESWGYDPETQRNLARRTEAVNSPGEWISPADYPEYQLHLGQMALVVFRLAVDTEGQVETCHVLRLIGSEAFGEAVCQSVTKHARLRPALDAGGNPVPSYYVNRVRFAIP